MNTCYFLSRLIGVYEVWENGSPKQTLECLPIDHVSFLPVAYLNGGMLRRIPMIHPQWMTQQWSSKYDDSATDVDHIFRSVVSADFFSASRAAHLTRHGDPILVIAWRDGSRGGSWPGSWNGAPTTDRKSLAPETSREQPGELGDAVWVYTDQRGQVENRGVRLRFSPPISEGLS